MNARIIDLAPTFLYLMGSKVPEDMDGRVLKEALTENFLKEHFIQFSKVTSGEEKAGKKEGSEEESAELIERLKGLGYLS
jgi:hypothetical protein